MRIERIQVESFGRLAGLDTGPEALGPLVVVLGPNEAGKSTLFSFLTTALYGFQPASRDRNPHIPWGSDEAAGSVRIRLGDKECAEVERRLRSAPSGKLTIDGRIRELRNQPLPWVEHVPRTVFRQVFAVTLADLAGLDEETWGRIQDRVLGSMGAADLRPARAVAATLEREAGEIWRPSRRGNQQLRELQNDIRALRSRRLSALERDREIRTLVEERENLQVCLGETRASRQLDRTGIERIQELLPLKRRLERIEALREEGGPREELAAFPSHPKERMGELKDEVERLKKLLASADRDLEGPERAVAQFDDSTRALLSQRDRISHFLARTAGVGADHTRASELCNELVDLEFRVRSSADHLLSKDLDADTSDALASISIDLLRDRVDRFAVTKRGETDDPLGSAHSAQASTPLTWGPLAALCVVGLALFAWGLSGGPAATTPVGVGLLAAGVTAAYLLLRSRASARVNPVALDDHGLVDKLADEISELLRGLPIQPEYLAPVGDPLVLGLERLQNLFRQWKDRTHALRSVTERLEAADADAITFAASLGYEAESQAREFAHRLDRELREAERIEDAAAAAERERARITRGRDTLESELKEAEESLSTLEEGLTSVGGGPEGSPIEVVQRRIQAHARANQAQDELERTYPDLADLKLKVRTFNDRGDSWAMSEEDLARLKARVEESETQIEDLVERMEAMGRDATHLRELETIDAVDSEIATLQENESRLVVERDRKWVLAQLLREADRRFREEHQPDLIRRASSYLEHLTGGRYDRLLVDEQGRGDLFQLVGPGIPAPIPLARPISTGTLEQAYLSLRLAIVDHLDQANQRLPLFIDEAFVNWDDERRDRGLDVLATLSMSRQVFAFTCHPEMAERLEARGGHVLKLERDG